MRHQFRFALFAFAMLVVTASPAFASAIIIDSTGVPTNTNISTYFPGATLSTVDNGTATDGNVYTVHEGWCPCDMFAWMPAGGDPNTDLNTFWFGTGRPSLKVVFDDPWTAATLYWGADTVVAEMDVYGPSGSLLATITGNANGDPLLYLGAQGPLKSIVARYVGPAGFYDASSFSRIEVEGRQDSQVAEPFTAALLLVGAGALYARRRVM